MKISLKLPFSESEKKVLKKTALISTLTCVVAVIIAWVSQSVSVKSSLVPQKSSSQNTGLLPIDIEAHKDVAFRLIKNGKPQYAIPHLQRILSANDSNFEIKEKLAQAFLESGDYAKALAMYDRIIQNSEFVTANIYAKRGITLYYLGNVDESRKYLEDCLSRFPNSVESYCFLGQIEASYGNYKKTHDYLQKAIKLDSSNTESWYQMARYQMELKDYKVARLLLLNALDIDPLHAKSHSRLGMIYYYLENPVLAKNSYQTALALNPEDFNTHYNLGELYLQMLGDTVKAVNEYKNTLQLSPSHTEANFRMGSICTDNRMYKEAVLHFEKALKTDNNNIRILLQLAIAYEKLSNIHKARSVYEQIIKIDALNVIARQKLRLLSASD